MTPDIIWVPLQHAWRAVTSKADTPRLQERLLRDAFRDGAIPTVASYFIVGGSCSQEQRGIQPDARFWRYADVDWQSGAAIRAEMSVLCEPNSESVVDLPRAETLGLYVSERDLRERWYLPDFYDYIGNITAKETSKRKGLGGRKGDYDWESALIEGSRWMYHEGVPRTQAALVRHVLEWFGDDAPSEAQAKEHLGPLYAALKAG